MNKIVEKLQDVQLVLKEQQLDGWLFYDFRRTNDLACQFLEIPSDNILTRRFFYWIPSDGDMIKIVHAIEDPLTHLPGKPLQYRTWQEMESHLKTILKNCKKVAMEYSPRNAIPYVSKVDGGTIDLVRGFGAEVRSSCDLLQNYTSIWDAEKLQMHRNASQVLKETTDKVWNYIAVCLSNQEMINEYTVQQFILDEFRTNGCISADSPICAINENSANPHYTPSKEKNKTIKPGDFILIDLWCKQSTVNAVYADITRMGVASQKPTSRQQEIFDLVKCARDAAIQFVKERFLQKIPVMGWEVDQACRQVINDAGFGEFFIHRTGHNIDVNDHGNGANIDNYETQDRRMLLPKTCFSIEPGIYLPGEFGVRLESNVYVHANGEVEITDRIQEAITCIL